MNKFRKLLKDFYYFCKYVIRVPRDRFRHNSIDKTNRIAKGAGVTLCRFGKYNYVAPMTGMYNVTMGNYCSIGPQIIMGGMEHSHWWYSMSPILSDKVDSVPETIIGNDVWVGANSVIRAGIKIGDGAVIGAHSFVNKDVPPYAIVVGSPARVLRNRFEESTIKKLQDSKYWQYEPDKAKEILARLEANDKSM